MSRKLALAILFVLAGVFVVAQSALAQTPRVRVNDQSLENGTVTVRVVVSDGPGWVVIHRQRGSSPGAVIGHAVVADGRTRDVLVPVDTERTTDTIYAMLHRDTGKLGTYEFPDGDPPARANNNIVVVPFDLEDSGS